MFARILAGNHKPTEIDGFSAHKRAAGYAAYCLGGTVLVGLVRIIIAVGYLIKLSCCSESAKAKRKVGHQKKQSGSGAERTLAAAKGYFTKAFAAGKDKINGVAGQKAFWKDQALRGLAEMTVMGGWYMAYCDNDVDNLDSDEAISMFGLQEVSDMM
ncbi:MAG: hypothetical protein H7A36_03165 [Chlamydiales bacterium]|nr:hypothetical protein [Chlamydiales bacterium]